MALGLQLSSENIKKVDIILYKEFYQIVEEQLDRNNEHNVL